MESKINSIKWGDEIITLHDIIGISKDVSYENGSAGTEIRCYNIKIYRNKHTQYISFYVHILGDEKAKLARDTYFNYLSRMVKIN